MEKQERKERKILTDNRLVTVNKRECSFEGLAGQLENGEDGIYNLINESKHTIFQPKIQITQRDLDTIPCLRQLRDAITIQEDALKRASGKSAFIIKKALIEMRKEQYIIKQAYQKPIIFCKITRSLDHRVPLEDKSVLLKNGAVEVRGVSLMDRRVVEAILCNYSSLKQDSWGDFQGDMWYLIQSFEQICDAALLEYPLYMRIVELKIEKKQNIEIQQIIQEEFGIKHSIEYISCLWRNKIPKLIAQEAKDDFLRWQYRIKNLPMKQCSRCGQIKPSNNNFFSKNNTSKDKFYSICKKCRNKKKRS